MLTLSSNVFYILLEALNFSAIGNIYTKGLHELGVTYRGSGEDGGCGKRRIELVTVAEWEA